jgi:hypothetical protein
MGRSKLAEKELQLSNLDNARSELQHDIRGIDGENERLRELLRAESGSLQEAIIAKKDVEKRMKLAVEELKRYE